VYSVVIARMMTTEYTEYTEDTEDSERHGTARNTEHTEG
jgi:hypothetical protein